MLSAALGIASSFAGNIASNKNIDTQIAAQQNENQKNRDWNLNLAKLQNQWNIDQWNRENAYNSPAAQMARYKAAGLNPDLIYGQPNLSAASPEMTSGDGSLPTDVSNLANKRTIGDIVSQAASTRLTNAQAKLAESQADKTDAETVGQTINNDWLPKLLKGQTEINEADVKQRLADAGLKGKQIEVAVEQIKVMQQSVKESQQKINDLQSQMENRTFQQVQAMLEYNLKKDKQSYEVREILSRIGVNSATARRIVNLLPYEIAESISRTGVNDATAALTFLKQGTEMIIQANGRLDNAQKSAMIDALKYDNYEKLMQLNSHLNPDGTEHMVSKCFRAIEQIVKAVSPLK
ncbi:hypothetical protein KSZ06_04865 [Bacteroides xylanisolvens]|uniref:hypothetical protein n=3 Tax=Bacteroides xylanisolvens TaxID=371601 RepID=UPI001C38CC7A|nr:hypothetical protein [Bacteroides xylanisolvens]MBV4042011.1 hypothetical protein [Bacteroides xylanisolvens]